MAYLVQESTKIWLTLLLFKCGTKLMWILRPIIILQLFGFLFSFIYLEFYLVSSKTGFKEIVLSKLNFTNLQLCESINNIQKL